ncbi:hypothetical protein CD30_07605 [Ureibacillus massiliensis 4400831 = CIP 108448 = CCUG 49529]|uniref:Ketoreductase domain-containing protein n=1 Tax=Ureibacillus massiliensis 4400831 = CIP 108448 = CCUG 49529 TaxID=1211035 RepID=A0A0A3J271_9BACL|nr:SDR family NAD(P)-dependent oxidoreductase [Ureibacillus massiliensis]KGR91124.1 hypothetical protein CD30_07605 [Ureibacillus massiliensis 4400831 = CIP 108448 = CCUG 49529]BDH62640.1 2-deoxy-D-gluconate 3-dehydrogenase [Lysinibacillus sp. PLM2]
MRLFDLSGKKAIVTGGNRGIGRAISLGLAEAGAEVIIISRSSAEETIEEISLMGGKASHYLCDLGSREQRELLAQQILEEIDTVDILINNAGIQKRYPSEEFPLEVWDEVLEVNMTAVFHLCKLFGSKMLERGYGKIVNLASVISYQGGLFIPAYAASKAGVMNFTKTLSNEWAGRGVNVNCIAPGYIATEMNSALIADETRNQQILDRLPAKRWGKAEDLIGAAIFLSASASDYVNGITIPVDGGWLGR